MTTTLTAPRTGSLTAGAPVKGKVNRQQAVTAMEALRPFEGHGAISAEAHSGTYWGSTGHLPAAYREALYATADVVYVVLSYATPIAWVTASGDAVIPATKYSQTTSRHQSLVRQGLRHVDRLALEAAGVPSEWAATWVA